MEDPQFSTIYNPQPARVKSLLRLKIAARVLPKLIAESNKRIIVGNEGIPLCRRELAKQALEWADLLIEENLKMEIE